MHKKYGRAKGLSRLIYLDSVERENCTEVFSTKYLKRKLYKIFICYFHKFSALHYSQVFSTTLPFLYQFCVVSGFVSVALIYFFFIKTREPLVSEALIEIESAVAKQKKKCDFVSFKTFCL